jgi:hypothetical protein
MEGRKIISFTSDEMSAGDLDPLRRRRDWGALN